MISVLTVSICVTALYWALKTWEQSWAVLAICSWGRCQATLMNSHVHRPFLPVLPLLLSPELQDIPWEIPQDQDEGLYEQVWESVLDGASGCWLEGTWMGLEPWRMEKTSQSCRP